jgi:hypothetical protein
MKEGLVKKILLVFSLILLVAGLVGCDEVSIDIKPQSCPNPFNVKSKGVLPVAILGTDGLDVNDVNVASIKLILVDEDPIVSIEVEAIAGKTDYNDVSAPLAEHVDCNCAETSPDGYMDLVVYFDSEALADAIEDFEDAIGETFLDNEEFPLLLVGELIEETDPDTYDIFGYDCILILKKGNRH